MSDDHITIRLRRGKARRGLTLIEVLATMLLMVIVLPVIMHGISLATTAASTSRHRNEATTLAESKLSELLATGSWQSGNLAGDFNPDWPDYQWTAQVQNWTEPDVQELDVNVMWTARNEQQTLTLSALVYPYAAPGSTSTSTSSTGSGSTSAAKTTGGK